MNKYIIHWDNIVKSTFLYGTLLQQDKRVTFENHQIPSGIVMHEWSMKSSFYNNRTKPGLPLLKRGTTYQMKFHYNAIPETSIYFKIECYKRNGERIVTHIIKEKQFEFEYPSAAYDYKIFMMSANVNTLTFDNIEITHDEAELDCSNAIAAFNRWSEEVIDHDKY
ncbi:accessory Sec system protein Asp3 [Macrococcus armenti]|uniref:Accessory Sec system protein Asp3 n=1 Tax=Macrococcus armenti TaxID=2875764 RepID=A0ABY3ZTW3_9STAP|nr:accessory Sec system protein Asp3 [Macrococcus armenti]UOB20344.1 accessory Sec system protein Asp3 [Macrococcus armenti]